MRRSAPLLQTEEGEPKLVHLGERWKTIIQPSDPKMRMKPLSSKPHAFRRFHRNDIEPERRQPRCIATTACTHVKRKPILTLGNELKHSSVERCGGNTLVTASELCGLRVVGEYRVGHGC